MEQEEREAMERREWKEKERREKERKQRKSRERKEKVCREVEAYVFSCLERGVEKVTQLKQYGAAIRDFDDALTRAGQSDPYYSSKTLRRCLSDAHCWRGIAMYYIIQDNLMSRDRPVSNRQRSIITYDDVIEDFNKAISLKPNHASAYYWRGRVKHENARVEHWKNPHRTVIECEYETGAYESIIEDFDTAISLKSNHASAYYWRGRVKCGRVVYEAISAVRYSDKPYEEMVIIGPVWGFDPEEVKIGCLLNAAIQDFNEVIRLLGIKPLRPNCVEAFYWRGIAKYFLEQYEVAVQDFDEVIRLRPNCAGVHKWRGNAKFALKQYDAARHDYEKADALAAEANMTFDSWGEPLPESIFTWL